MTAHAGGAGASMSTTGLLLVGMVASGAVAGIFYAFSSFVMAALARLSSAEGIRAMQSINVVVLNRSFLGLFLGTALLSAAILVWGLLNRHEAWVPFAAAGAGCYLAGVFLVTGLGNVPLNDALGAIWSEAPEAGSVWTGYLRDWTRLNHVRTLGGILASALYGVALLRHSAAP